MLPFGKIDLDGNGYISDNEFYAARKTIRKVFEQIDEQNIEYQADYPAGLPIADFAKRYKTKDVDEKQQTLLFEDWGILIRDSPENLDIAQEPQSQAKAKSATIALARNIAADKTTLTLKGAIMRPVRFGSNPDFQLYPSLQINRVRNKPESAKDVDTLAIRIGMSKKVSLSKTGPVEDLYLRLNPTYTTDSHFNSDIRSIELQVEPVAIGYAIGKSKRLGPIDFRLLPMVHYEYGRVFDNGDEAELVEDDTISRLGTKLELQIWPVHSDRLSAVIKYEYLATVSGNQRDRRIFQMTMSYAIDKAQHYSIQLKYANGDTSVKLEDEEAWFVGFGVRF